MADVINRDAKEAALAKVLAREFNSARLALMGLIPNLEPWMLDVPPEFWIEHENIDIENLEINTVTRFDVVPERIAQKAAEDAKKIEQPAKKEAKKRGAKLAVEEVPAKKAPAKKEKASDEKEAGKDE